MRTTFLQACRNTDNLTRMITVHGRALVQHPVEDLYETVLQVIETFLAILQSCFQYPTPYCCRRRDPEISPIPVVLTAFHSEYATGRTKRGRRLNERLLCPSHYFAPLVRVFVLSSGVSFPISSTRSFSSRRLRKLGKTSRSVCRFLLRLIINSSVGIYFLDEC